MVVWVRLSQLSILSQRWARRYNASCLPSRCWALFTDSMNESLDLNMSCCKDDKAMRLAEQAFVDNSLELDRCQRVGLLGSALRAGAARQVASDRFGPSAQSARGSNRRFLCQSKPQPKYRRKICCSPGQL